MPKVSTVLYSTKQGITNIKRNRMFSLASIGTMTACLFLFGIFYFVLVNFRYMLKSAETNVGITVFFESYITDDDIYNIGLIIKARPEVESVKYVSAEEAWKDYKEKYIDKNMADSFGDDNPLKDSSSYVVYLKEVASQNTLVKFIESIDGIRKVYNSEQIAEVFDGVNKAVGYVSGGIIAILLCVAAFLISTTVTMGISVRKQEISIMKLIGASDFFIRAPYVVEGILIGAIGACIPLVFLDLIYKRILQFITERFASSFNTSGFVPSSQVFSVLVPISLGIGMGIGFLGSFMTVRKQLKKIN